MTDALPLVDGLLDETVRLLSKAVKELGVVAKENLNATLWRAQRAYSVGSTPE
ncbi:hypothetical protein [Streptomyces sp. NPDC001056]